MTKKILDLNNLIGVFPSQFQTELQRQYDNLVSLYGPILKERYCLQTEANSLRNPATPGPAWPSQATMNPHCSTTVMQCTMKQWFGSLGESKYYNLGIFFGSMDGLNSEIDSEKE